MVYLLLLMTQTSGQNAAKFSFFIFATICHILEWIWSWFDLDLMDGLDILSLEIPLKNYIK